MKNIFIGIQGASKHAMLAACREDGSVIQVVLIEGPLALKLNTDFKISLDRALDRLAKVTGFGRRTAMLEASQSLAVSMTGVFQQCDDYAVRQNLRDFGFRIEPIISEDVWAVLAAEGCDDGCVVMASTGAIVFVRNESSASVTVGGWGSDIADQGSGFHIGIMAIRRVLEHMDGRVSVPQTFVDQVLASLDLASPAQIIPWYHEVRRTSYWRPKIADVAIAVVRLAEIDEMQAAQDILSHGVTGLTRSLEAAIKRSTAEGIVPERKRFPIVLAGGLGIASRTYKAAIESSIEILRTKTKLFDPVLTLASNHPIVGTLAFAIAGRKGLPDKDIYSKISNEIRAKILNLTTQ